MRFRLMGNDKLLPVRVRGLFLRRDDLYLIAAIQLVFQSNNLAIDFCAEAVRADVGVNGKTEIYGRRAARQNLQFPFRCKYINLVLIEIELKALEQLLGSRLFVGVFENIAHPRDPVLQFLIQSGTIFFVLPMRRYSLFSDLMHRTRTDLYFDHFAIRANHGCMKRLVAVLLRHRDIIFEAFGYRQVDGRNNSVCGKTIVCIFGIEDDTNCEEIINFIERFAAFDHLVEDAEQMLRTALDLERNLRFAESLFNGLNKLLDVRLALFTFGFELVGNFFVFFGMEIFEREILHLPFHFGDPEPVGEWRVNIDCLFGKPLLLFGRQVFEGAHVMQAVGEFQEHHADVAHHRKKHFPVTLGLSDFVAAENIGNLRGAIDNVRNDIAELCPDILDLVLGVFGDVVHQRAGDRNVIERNLAGDDHRYFIRMVEEGFARRSHIVLMRFKAEFKRAADKVFIDRSEIFSTNGEEIFKLLLVDTVSHCLTNSQHCKNNALTKIYS